MSSCVQKHTRMHYAPCAAFVKSLKLPKSVKFCSISVHRPQLKDLFISYLHKRHFPHHNSLYILENVINHECVPKVFFFNFSLQLVNENSCWFFLVGGREYRLLSKRVKNKLFCQVPKLQSSMCNYKIKCYLFAN